MKKLIVLATLAALPAAAMADVVISGNIGVAYVNTKVDEKGALTTQGRTAGEIKFAGNEDLGNGLKAIWQVASRIDVSDSKDTPTVKDADGNKLVKSSAAAFANAWGTRDSFVGLQGSFGTVKLGNIYFMPNSGAMSIFENNSAGFASDIYDQGTRVNNTLSYTAPTVAGLTATVQHSTGASNKAEGNKDYVTALDLAYEGNGFTASYDLQRTNDHVADKRATLQELNASVSLDALTLMAGYAHNKASDESKRSGYGIAASYAMGNITPKIAYWKEGDLKQADGTKVNDGHKAYAVGVEYALSKRTRAGFELAKVSYDDKDTAALMDDGDGRFNTRTASFYLGTKF